MASENFPSSLPYPNSDQFSENMANAKIETQMDSGPVQMRNLYTAVPTTYTLQLRLTSDEVDTFIDFYKNNCSNGVEEFNWIHPRTLESAIMRFIGSPPMVSLYAYDAFNVSFSVEILP